MGEQQVTTAQQGINSKKFSGTLKMPEYLILKLDVKLMVHFLILFSRIPLSPMQESLSI